MPRSCAQQQKINLEYASDVELTEVATFMERRQGLLWLGLGILIGSMALPIVASLMTGIGKPGYAQTTKPNIMRVLAAQHVAAAQSGGAGSQKPSQKYLKF